MFIERWLEGLERLIEKTMRKQLIFCYMDMELDLPIIPEDPKEYRRFKLTSEFRARSVKADVFRDWISKFPGQSTYLASQVWFTQKLLSIFQGANDKAKTVEQIRRQRKMQRALSRANSGEKEQSESENSDPYDSHDSEDGEYEIEIN